MTTARSWRSECSRDSRPSSKCRTPMTRILGLSIAAAVGVGLVMLSHHPASAKTSCAMREDLAGNPGIAWADLRAACDAEQKAYEQQDPVGYHWFTNAGNGFTGFPY